MRFVLKYILPLLAPFKKNWSSPKRAARVVTKILINASGQTGIYYDDRGSPMLGSAARARPEVSGSRRRRDTRLAVDGASIKEEGMISIIRRSLPS